MNANIHLTYEQARLVGRHHLREIREWATRNGYPLSARAVPHAVVRAWVAADHGAIDVPFALPAYYTQQEAPAPEPEPVQEVVRPKVIDVDIDPTHVFDARRWALMNGIAVGPDPASVPYEVFLDYMNFMVWNH